MLNIYYLYKCRWEIILHGKNYSTDILYVKKKHNICLAFTYLAMFAIKKMGKQIKRKCLFYSFKVRHLFFHLILILAFL